MKTYLITNPDVLTNINLKVSCMDTPSAEVIPLVTFLGGLSATVGVEDGDLVITNGKTSIKIITFDSLIDSLQLKSIEVDLDKYKVTKVSDGGYAYSLRYNQFCKLTNGLSKVLFDSGKTIDYDRSDLIPIRKTKEIEEFFPNMKIREQKKADLIANSKLKLNIGDTCMVQPYETLVAKYGETDETYINPISDSWGAPFYKGHSWICSKPLRVTGYNETLGVYYAELIEPIVGTTTKPGAIAGTFLYTSFMETVDSYSEIPDLPIILHESILTRV